MSAAFRYIVHEVEPAIDFYERLGFELRIHPGPGFAMLERDGLRLLLNTPAGGGGAGQAMADGALPQPGGWNRVQLPVDDLERVHEQLAAAGVRLRSEIITGNGGWQPIAEDPSGNAIELFEAFPR